MSLKMKKFFKNYWLIIFLALIASLLIGIFFIKKDEGPWVNPNLEKLLPLPYPKFKEYQLKIPLNFNDLLKNSCKCVIICFPKILSTSYSFKFLSKQL